MLRGQDAQLPGFTARVCADAGITLAQIQRFAVITGPGSFTGIRIGIAFARGLALALQKPCLGITSLEASLPPGQQGSALVLLPAQRRLPDLTFWVQSFRTGIAVSEPEEISAEALEQRLQAHPHILYGDVTAAHLVWPTLSIRPAVPTAQRAGVIAETRDPEHALPRARYVRDPDAALPASQTK